MVQSTSPSTFAKRSRWFLAQELENVWLFRHCTCPTFTQAPTDKFVWVFTSKQKFKSICWIFPVKTQMEMNLFYFTCQNTKLIYSDTNEFSNKFFWICILTREINLVNIYRLLFIFFQIKFAFWQEKQVQKIDLNFVFWQVKTNKFICIFVLTAKIQQIDLNFCSDVLCLKSQTFSHSCRFRCPKPLGSLCKSWGGSRRNQTRQGLLL